MFPRGKESGRNKLPKSSRTSDPRNSCRLTKAATSLELNFRSFSSNSSSVGNCSDTSWMVVISNSPATVTSSSSRPLSTCSVSERSSLAGASGSAGCWADRTKAATICFAPIRGLNPFWKAPGQWDWPPCLCETNFPVLRTAYLLLLVLHLPLEGFSLIELPCSPSETPWGLPFQGLSAASEFHLASPCRLQHRCTAGSGTCLPPNVAWPPRQYRSSRLVMVVVSCAELPAWRLETWRKRPGLLLATRHLHPGRS